MDYVIVIAVVILVIALLVIIYRLMSASQQQSAAAMPVIAAPAPSTAQINPAPTPNNTPTAPPSPVTVSVPEYVGCFIDQQSRALPTKAPGYQTIDNCNSLAKKANSAYFGMQYTEGAPAGSGTAECWYGAGQYNKYGASSQCPARDSQGRILGSVWTNAIYKTN